VEPDSVYDPFAWNGCVILHSNLIVAVAPPIRYAVLGNAMSTKRVQIIVRGRVSGAFFRPAAQREARRLGISGWVRNRPDGTVELLAEGEEDAIKEIVSWAQHGPSAARVDDVDVRWRSYTGEFSEFSIVE
jgi:acylphosphatase